jgi:hypothetical protein
MGKLGCMRRRGTGRRPGRSEASHSEGSSMPHLTPSNHGTRDPVHLLLVIDVSGERVSGKFAICEVRASVLAWRQIPRVAKRRRTAPMLAQAMAVAQVQRQQEEQTRARGRVALHTVVGTRKLYKTLLAPSRCDRL